MSSQPSVGSGAEPKEPETAPEKRPKESSASTAAKGAVPKPQKGSEGALKNAEAEYEVESVTYKLRVTDENFEEEMKMWAELDEHRPASILQLLGEEDLFQGTDEPVQGSHNAPLIGPMRQSFKSSRASSDTESSLEEEALSLRSRQIRENIDMEGSKSSGASKPARIGDHPHTDREFDHFEPIQIAPNPATKKANGLSRTVPRNYKAVPWKVAKDGSVILKACIVCGMSAKASPMMRKGPDGVRSLCNACGLKFTRGRPFD